MRARAIRLAKAENKRTATPPLCSFNLEAFGLMFVERGMNEPDALLALWERGSRDLQWRLTPDPAGVSGSIKVADQREAADRLASAAERLRTALAHDENEEHVRRTLHDLWPEFIALRPGEVSKARVIAASKSGTPLHITSTGMLSATTGTTLKAPRSFGDAART